MEELPLYKGFAAWLDSVLAAPVPSTIAGFNLNLYEAQTCFHAQLIGASRFDRDDDSWAADEVFSTGENIFRLPHESVGATWRDGINATNKFLLHYILSGTRADILRAAKAVTVGFVDGDLQPVWLRKDA